MRERDTMVRWLPPILWMGVIFVASSLPGNELGAVSDYSLFGHLGEYAILGVLLFLAARRTWPMRTAVLFTAAAASAYGVTDELHQILTPGRMPDPADWVTDTVGALLGIALVLVVETAVSRTRA